MDSPKRFVVVCAPTAFGKTLMYAVASILTDSRTAFLTATTALQHQISGDFAEVGMVEIKGLNRYECLEGQPTGKFGDMRREGFRADKGLPMMCDEAPCQAGAFCPRRSGGCLYYDAYAKVTSLGTKLITPNYAYWMSINKHGEGLGPVDMLVLDEAHQAMDELTGFIGTELRRTDLSAHFSDAHLASPATDQIGWIKWAANWRYKTAAALEVLKAKIRDAEKGVGVWARVSHKMLRDARELRQLQHKLDTVATMRGDWVIEWTKDTHDHQLVKFNPVQPSEYAEGTLFLGTKKVVMVSAVARPDMAIKLGIHPDDIDFKEYPSPIPKENRPIIYFPTAHMSKNSAAAGKDDWHRGMDQIIGRRLDRKGIIHTVSYSRMREVYEGSQYKQMMIVHDSTDTAEKIDLFKKSTRPVIIVSPVLDTGYDFPYTEAEYQIIAKVPFPVMIDEIVKARAAKDPGYRDYLTMVKVVQMAGRICRAADDQGETFIVDMDFWWWWYGTKTRPGYRPKMPYWFNEAVRYEQVLSQPLPKLKVA